MLVAACKSEKSEKHTKSKQCYHEKPSRLLIPRIPIQLLK